MKGTKGVAAVFSPTIGAGVTDRDIAILKLLATATLAEDDLWQRYCELVLRHCLFVARSNPSIRH